MDKQIIKNTKLKGTVLFTVVSVMMVLIVFVMATLTIASAASKRSYNTYFKNQSLYSARSVVDTTVNELLDGDATNTLKNEATKLSAGDILELSCELPAGMGTVTDLRVEYAGTDDIGTGNFLAGTGDGIVRVTATVEMSGQASTYSQYVLKSAVVTTPAISEGALVSMGGGLSNAGSTSPKIYGSTYAFNYDSTDVKSSWSVINNLGSINSLNYNSSLRINTATKGLFERGSGIYVGGHLLIDNQPEFRSKVGKDDNLRYSEIPYIYAGGVFYKNNSSSVAIGTDEKPINIYCGSMNGNGGMQNFTTYGDIYAYDGYDGLLEMVETNVVQTGLTVFGGGGGGSSLLNWVDGLVNSTDGNFASHTGGSFYSNGRLQITGNGSTFEGDVIVKDTVTINPVAGDVSIGGSLYAEKELVISTDKNITISGGLFCDPTKLTVTGNVKINGVIYGGDPVAFITDVNAASTVDATKASATQAKISATPPTIFPKTMDRDYLFKGDLSLIDTDEIAKTITLIDNQDIKKTFEATVNGITEYKDYKAKPEDAGDSYSRVYTSADKDYTESTPLTENCTLYGTWSEDIYIKPSAGQTIWITLANFELQNNNKIVVDNTTNPANPGTVYFFVPEKGTVNYVAGVGETPGTIVETSTSGVAITGNLSVHGKIITSYYDTLNESIDLTKYPADKKKIPNIFLYMAGGKKPPETPGAEAPKLIIQSKGTITGYVCAPYITLVFPTTEGLGGAITYDGAPITNAQVAVIGQVIVGEIEQFNNDAIILQVSPNAAGGGGSGGGGTTGGDWTEIENAYGFGG